MSDFDRYLLAPLLVGVLLYIFKCYVDRYFKK